MAIELNNRTKILAGVVVLAAAGAGAWLFFFQDDAPPQKTVVTSAAKSAPKDAPEAAKAADAPKAAECGEAAADAPKQADAAKPTAAKPAPKPAPGSPEQLVAEVVDASGVKTQFQAFSRETLLKAILGGEQAPERGGRTSSAVTTWSSAPSNPAKLARSLPRT